MAAQGPTTATPAVMTSTSRLTQMQMRFQQRQQQERDQRKVEMVSATKTVTATSGSSTSSNRTIHSSATAIHHSVTTSSSSTATAAIQQDLSASLGAGKVRQMFEQRKAAGIDKSYPLQPIGQVVSGGKNGASNGSTAAPSKVAAANGLNNKTRVPPISANTKARLARQQQQHHQQENGNGEVLSKSGGAFDDNENLLEDEKFPDTISFDEEFALPTGTPLARKLPNVGKITTPSSVTNGNTVPAQNVNSLKLKPVPGRTPTTSSLKATPAAAAPKKTPPATVATPSANPSSPRGSQPSSAKSRASTGRSGTGAGSRKSSAVSVASASVASVDNGPVPDGMARCSVCGRNFAEDRVAKHMEICRKTKSKKRKVFDVTKHRVQGTDAEKYVLRKGKAASSGSKKSISGTTAAPPAAGATSGGKGDWRRKHEEFIAAIRAAKEMKAYLAKGGKLSDLPPPPPSENPDYVQCPHCSRRFNQTAAERHIPKCATMLHNKPKPAAKRRV
uniref:Putative secreted protein n=1 Tax=Culex tarsalis TaxID=7177 RepID=A0A1Q3FZV6_CULTA